MKKCKTCKHWDIKSAKQKGKRIMANTYSECLYPKPVVPDAMFPFHDLRYSREFIYRTVASSDGGCCEAWEKRR